MNSAWRDHSPGDGNVNTAALNRLNMIMESTRVDVDHVLQMSGGKTSRRIPWKPDTFDLFYPSACPEPYTSLRQFHRPVMPFAHPDLPHAQRPPYSDSVAGRASHTSYSHTTSSRRPDQVTRVVTPGQDGTATVHTKPTMQTSPTHITKPRTIRGRACLHTAGMVKILSTNPSGDVRTPIRRGGPQAIDTFTHISTRRDVARNHRK